MDDLLGGLGAGLLGGLALLIVSKFILKKSVLKYIGYVISLFLILFCGFWLIWSWTFNLGPTP
jgi:hypothetical protein